MPETFRGWRGFLPAMILAAGGVLLASARHQEIAKLSRPLRDVRLEFTGFAGESRSISEDEQRVAGMSDYSFRVFRSPTDSMQLFSTYVGYYESQATGRTIHSPRNCLPGAGWQTVESGTRTLQVGGEPVTVNRYILANGPMQAMVYYWYQGRGRVAWNEYTVKWDLLRDAATRGRTEEALVRIMVPIPPSQQFNATEWQERLARADDLASRVAVGLVPVVEQALPRWRGPVT
ncbi:MAG TPA: EpsI family protein [Gemmatimonadaceae bacterium]|nr:EpsI family protein [Gemmatimonadaceae bacterium]